MHQWDIPKTPYAFGPRLATANKRNNDRFISITKNSISVIDPIRMRETDDFYKLAQMHREQYKDETGSLHPLNYFKNDDYLYQCAPGTLHSYFFKYPEYYTEYKVPPVLPLTYGRATKTPYIPELAFPGIYDRGSCTAYKR